MICMMQIESRNLAQRSNAHKNCRIHSVPDDLLDDGDGLRDDVDVGVHLSNNCLQYRRTGPKTRVFGAGCILIGYRLNTGSNSKIPFTNSSYQFGSLLGLIGFVPRVFLSYGMDTNPAFSRVGVGSGQSQPGSQKNRNPYNVIVYFLNCQIRLPCFFKIYLQTNPIGVTLKY